MNNPKKMYIYLCVMFTVLWVGIHFEHTFVIEEVINAKCNSTEVSP